LKVLERVTALPGSLCLVLLAGEARAAIPASERAALIALYDSTSGAGWWSRTNWLGAPGTECTWLRVTCDAHESHVTHLRLTLNHLDGTIPSEIGDLPSLLDLSLDANELRGPIPPQVANLTSLEHLWLDGNDLTGSIPPQIGALTGLRVLALGNSVIRREAGRVGNQLSGPIPAEIGGLQNLQDLYLDGNRLDGPIPPEIGNLKSLELLYLSGNQLSGSIPPELGGLPRLRELYLDANQLTGAIPSELGSLQSLELLGLSSQWSVRFPYQVGGLGSRPPQTNPGNRLSGPIPPEIGNLASLWYLDASGNQLDGSIPPQISGLASLIWLDLSGNRLSGPIPPQISGLARLSELDLSGNQLDGWIPPQISGFARLESLDLSGNRLDGSIPPQISGLATLRRLNLSGNQLSGSIPPEVGYMTSLSSLLVSGNQLRGSVPAALGRLTQMASGYSDLRWNALYTDDPTLRSFLNSCQIGGDWESTQTLAPTALAAGSPTLDTVPLSWTPILYAGDTGGYRIGYGTIPGGPYNLFEATADKSVSTSTVSGLSPATSYYFSIDTVTNPHPSNPNTVVSARGADVPATTTTGGLIWFNLTVSRQGPGTVSSSPAGIVCGGVCDAGYAPGTSLTLTAAPDGGMEFLGWEGACNDSAPTCTLTMDSVNAITATFSTPATSFHTVTPCRVFDSRDPGLGGPSPLAAGTDRVIAVAGLCGIPAMARAVSVSATVVSPTAAGYLALYASGTPRPGTSSINYGPGQTRASNAIVALGPDGAIAVHVNQASGTTHLVVDVGGCFQ
jgi:Leucine-rich repeat (LRR) protein